MGKQCAGSPEDPEFARLHRLAAADHVRQNPGTEFTEKYLALAAQGKIEKLKEELL